MTGKSIEGEKKWEDIFFFKQATAYEIYQCDWSSDVCSSDLLLFSLPEPFFDCARVLGKASAGGDSSAGPSSFLGGVGVETAARWGDSSPSVGAEGPPGLGGWPLTTGPPCLVPLTAGGANLDGPLDGLLTMIPTITPTRTRTMPSITSDAT